MRSLRTAWRGSAAALVGVAALAGPGLAQAVPSPRVALVVGEGAYRSGPLPAAPNDAGLVAQVLAGAGFDVTAARDLDGDGLRRAFRDFLDRAGAAGPDGIAVVYLAGRAIQADGDNFIVPVDARLARPSDVPIEALRLADFTHALAALPIQAKVVVVDGAYAGGTVAGGTAGGVAAGSAPGLALVEAEQGELLAFNAAPGTLAPPGAGPFGAYAQALVAAVKQGGVPVGEVFDRVRLAVNGATGGAVVPWDSDRLTRSFTFFDRAPGAPAVASAQVPFAALEKRPLRDFPPDQAYDVAVARDTLPAYAEFLAAFPGDPLARRIRLFQAVRRESLFWRAALGGNTPGAFWTYLARYPRGSHAADARRRLTRLAAAPAPPARFVALGFDVPPPPPDEVVVERVVDFALPDLPPPPPPPVFLLPPLIEVVMARPVPPQGPGFLPVPVPVAIPYVRAPAEPGLIAPPRGMSGGYSRPRPYARGANGDGLVQATPGEAGPHATPPGPVPSPVVPGALVPRAPTPPVAAVPPVVPSPPADAGPVPHPQPSRGRPPASGGTPETPPRRTPMAAPHPLAPAPVEAAPVPTVAPAQASPAPVPHAPDRPVAPHPAGRDHPARGTGADRPPPLAPAPAVPPAAPPPSRSVAPVPHAPPPDRPVSPHPAAPDHAPTASGAEHPPRERRPACGHPGETPCRP